jgi:beta-glucosidase
MYQLGVAGSDELRAQYNKHKIPALTFWAPVVELARDPRWGRNAECFGEDPCLTSQLTLAMVKGVQGDHPKYLKTHAAPKHFVANNEEWDRHNGSSNIDEQLLFEYYLKPYQVLIQEGKAESIMGAYNRLNEIPCLANKFLLTDVLRDQWGFTGTVVTDCNGIRDLFTEGMGHKYVKDVYEAIAAAVNAGIDLECGDEFKKYLSEVVQRGDISEAMIDRAVGRIFLSRFKLGLYDPPERVPYNQIPHSVIGSQKHRDLARQVAREAIILLKNRDNLLPLDKNTINSVAVIGPNADVCNLGGYSNKSAYLVTPLEGIRNKIGGEKVQYVKGTDINITAEVIPAEYLIPPNARPGEHGLLGEYFNNTDCSGEPVFSRVDSVINFNYGGAAPEERIKPSYYSIRWTGKLIAPVTGPYFIGGSFDDAIRLYLDHKKIIDKTKNRNQSSAAAKVQLQKGQHYDLRIEFTQHWYRAKMTLFGGPPVPNKFDAAIAAAKSADVAIVVIGTDESVEKEGVDRSSLALPGDQDDLIQAIFAANPKTIVVLQNGAPLTINWAKEHVPAIIETFTNGQEGGNALADVIFGDYNPAGRLPLTFYASDDQLPSFSDYDIRKGRTYMYPLRNFANPDSKNEAPLFAFGYGLSYTQFEYTKLKISPKKINPDGKVTVSVTVKNVGERAGDEVVQLYLRDVAASVPRPLKQLAGFERIHIKPGESRKLQFEISAKEMAFWDVSQQKFVVEPGKFEVLVGSSSENIHLQGDFIVK